MPKNILRLHNLLYRFMQESMYEQIEMSRRNMISLCSERMGLNFGEKLNRIICPVLVLYSAKDYSNHKSSRILASLPADAQLKIVDHSAREMNLDAPVQLAEILNGFYSRLLE